MRKYSALAALVAAGTLLMPAASAADRSQPRVGEASHGLTLVAKKRLSPRLHELTFRTRALTEATSVRVLLPAKFDVSGRTRYPVMFLLHGGVDDYRSWTDKGNAERVTAGHPVIVVMPDGGSDGNYVDWYNFGAFGPPMWETYHIRQLLPWVDAHYPTKGTRDARAIAGLSMGGAGATHYAARHPTLFSAVGSFSGAVDTNNLFVIPITETGGLQEGKPPSSVYGPRALQEIRWRGDNAWDLAENFRGMTVTVATGNGEPSGREDCSNFDFVERAVYEMGVSLHRRLAKLGITHVWDDYGPGCHNWFYWERELGKWMPRMMQRFARPRPVPVPFEHKAIETRYEVYGWNVVLDRPALEWSTIRDVRPNGFTLHGSGKATVTTPPRFKPGKVANVEVFGMRGYSRRTIRASRNGRLHIPLSLGPGNPFQEHTAQQRAWTLSQATSDGIGNSTETASAVLRSGASRHS